MAELTHFNEAGRARMVDVSTKDETEREAVARGRITMQPATLSQILKGKITKGDVLGVAQISGIMGAKATSRLIPMCHPLLLTGVDLTFSPDEAASSIDIEARVRITGKTGVEMEALTAVSVAALTIYDMCKAVDKGMTIDNIRLVTKTGGKSGNFQRIVGKIVAVCTSASKGERKKNVGRGMLVTGFGLQGDAHGGPWHRQVSLLAVESIAKMRQLGLDVGPGDFAENLTTEGIELVTLPVGTKLRLGDKALGEVTQIGKECHAHCAIYKQAGDCVMPKEGIFIRIINGGEVKIGDEIEVANND